MAIDRVRTLRGALAGGIAAAVWAAQQPLDKRFFDSDYDDVELLGRAVVPDGPWFPVGLAIHVSNGVAFGASYANIAPLVPLPAWTRGPLMSLIENFGLWPMGRVSDRLHPARRQLPALTGNRRALAQATWRHLLFGVVMGELERRLNPPEDADLPEFDEIVAGNGHGDIEALAASADPS